MDWIRKHWRLLILLAAYLSVAVIYSLRVPLGEAPDEAEHMAYVQFIAEHRRPPASLAERQMVGYKSVWPPLYHSLTALVVAPIDTSSPAPLKKVSSSPRRLLVYDGLTEINAIHTADEAFPYHGLFLAWHLARLVSVLLGAGVVLVTYLIALEIFPGNRNFALGAAALAAFIPRFTFTTSVLNDDNLLNFIATLALLILVRLWKGKHTIRAYLSLGIMLGLGLTTKYSALSLGLELVVVSIILSLRPQPGSPVIDQGKNRAGQGEPGRRALINRMPARLLLLISSAIVTSSWWFTYIEWHFNQVEELGWFSGLLAPLTAGGIDTGSRRVMSLLTGGSVPMLAGEGAQPWSLTEFASWSRTFFMSFWAGFTHLDDKTALYWALLAVCILGMTGIGRCWRRLRREDKPRGSLLSLLVLHFAVFWPLILVRYAFSRKIVETAQGRYLFPAIAAISILLLYGLLQWVPPRWRVHGTFGISIAFLAFTVVSLPLFITAAYPPYLPVHTTQEAAQTNHSIHATLDGAIELIGYDLEGVTQDGALPVTVVWRSLDHATSDYVLDLTLVGEDGGTAGRWLGQPVNGRYPTRAWDPGDIVRDTVWLPVRGASAGDYRLILRVAPHLNLRSPIDESSRFSSAGQAFELTQVTLPNLSQVPPAHRWEAMLTPDFKLLGFDLWRADDPAPRIPKFAYRATVPVRLVWQGKAPEASSLEVRLGDHLPVATQDNLFLFFVGPDWKSGSQSLRLTIRQAETEPGHLEIDNVATANVRPRRFDAPSMSMEVHANFGDEITLLGYDFPERKGDPGDVLPITLYWQAQRPPYRHYIVSNHLLNSADLRQWGGRDRVPQNYYSTLLWSTGEVVIDEYQVPIDPSAPDGVYRLDIGLYAPVTGQARHLPLVTETGVLEANSVTIAPIKVGGPPPGITVQAPFPQHPRADNLEGLVTLLGYDLSLEPEVLKLTLYWRCDVPPPTDYTTFVHVRDTTGQPDAIVAQMDRPPADGAYPTSLWEPGEVIRDFVQVPIPSEVRPGEYEIVAGLYDFASGQRLLVLDDDGEPTGDHIRLEEEIILR